MIAAVQSSEAMLATKHRCNALEMRDVAALPEAAADGGFPGGRRTEQLGMQFFKIGDATWPRRAASRGGRGVPAEFSARLSQAESLCDQRLLKPAEGTLARSQRILQGVAPPLAEAAGVVDDVQRRDPLHDAVASEVA